MRSYDEMAEEVFRRADEVIENQRVRRNIMKKRIIALSAFCLAVLIGIGVWQADLFKTKPIKTPDESGGAEQVEIDKPIESNPAESTPAENEEPFTSQTTEQPESSGIGGDERLWYELNYDYKYHFFPSAIGEIVDNVKLKNWFNQFDMYNRESYTRTDISNVITAIEELDIKKEEFIAYYVEKNLFVDGKYYDSEGDLALASRGEDYAELATYYAVEEVDYMFSKDYDQRNRELVGEYAIHANGKNYSPKWIFEHEAEDFIAAGITKAQIMEKIPIWYEMAPNTEKCNELKAKIENMP